MSLSGNQPAAAEAVIRGRGAGLLRSFQFLGLIFVALSARAESNLLENSPFLPSGAAARDAQPAAPLELRSIFKADGQYEFSLYEPAKKQSTWVGLKEPGHDFLVKAFDEAHDTVTVEQSGRTYLLVLKEAKIASLGPADRMPSSPAVVASPHMGNAGQEMPAGPLTLDDLGRRRMELLHELGAVNAAATNRMQQKVSQAMPKSLPRRQPARQP